MLVVDVLGGVLGLAILASYVYGVWFSIKGIRHLQREAAPGLRRRAVYAVLGILAFAVVGAVAFVVGRHLWGTGGGAVLTIWVVVVLWLATFALAIRHDLKETPSLGKRDE